MTQCNCQYTLDLALLELAEPSLKHWNNLARHEPVHNWHMGGMFSFPQVPLLFGQHMAGSSVEGDTQCETTGMLIFPLPPFLSVNFGMIPFFIGFKD